ncbi:MAG: putative toxin-antitoxin system toxin component, PIN family [Spirochaetales bacterium]
MAGSLRNSRVVVDTNVWISAALSANGSPAKVVQLVLQNCVPVFSRETFAELEERIRRPKFDRYLSLDDRKGLLHDWNAAAFWVEILDDDMFVQAAVASGAVLLISGDADLLSVSPIKGLTIASPPDAIELF